MTITTLFQQQCLHLPSERIRLAIILPGTLPKEHVALGRLKHLSKGKQHNQNGQGKGPQMACCGPLLCMEVQKVPAHASMQKQTETGDSYCTQGSKTNIQGCLISLWISAARGNARRIFHSTNYQHPANPIIIGGGYIVISRKYIYIYIYIYINLPH